VDVKSYSPLASSKSSRLLRSLQLFTVSPLSYFVVDMQLWRSKFSPFVRRAQQNYCSKLIVVPLSVFHRMAESVGDPKGELIFIFNMGRCGSTLLTKVTIQYNTYKFI